MILLLHEVEERTDYAQLGTRKRGNKERKLVEGIGKGKIWPLLFAERNFQEEI